ncbi:chalcone isomerase family protein [Pseudothauera hydrothermalis]|uniref:chalcone isomerase family protein n=1 Tax=Pseudothauera hydrothermalis TaxID=2184083 RepID=UPI000E0984EF|nr:chalcone isomerase family protein [Pseudothauera hydrothermalis]
MTHFIRYTLATLALCATAVQAAVEVAGVRFDDRVTVEAQQIELNGAGLRTRFAFKVYAIGLYLPSRSQSAEAIQTAPGAKRIRIVLLRDVAADTFADALIDGLKKNHSAEQFAALQKATDQLRATLLELGEARAGTVVELDALADGSTRLSVNAQPRGTDIAEPAFYPALLRIWLGEHPVDGDLKRALLGQTG